MDLKKQGERLSGQNDKNFLRYFLVGLLLIIVVLFYWAIIFYYAENVAPVYYDVVLHVLAGVWLSAAAIYLLFYSKFIQYKANFWVSLLLVLGIVMFVGVLWELYEFAAFLATNVLLEPISDTMSDFVAEFAGGTAFFLFFWPRLKK